MNLRNLLTAIVKLFFSFAMPGCSEQKSKHRSGACRTCKSGVYHDCCSCRRKTRGRPSQIDIRPRPVAYPTNAAKRTRHRRYSAPAVYISTFVELATVRTDVPASATVPAGTAVPAGSSTVPAAITADVPATVPAAISSDATTADVPGTAIPHNGTSHHIYGSRDFICHVLSLFVLKPVLT